MPADLESTRIGVIADALLSLTDNRTASPELRCAARDIARDALFLIRAAAKRETGATAFRLDPPHCLQGLHSGGR